MNYNMNQQIDQLIKEPVNDFCNKLKLSLSSYINTINEKDDIIDGLKEVLFKLPEYKELKQKVSQYEIQNNTNNKYEKDFKIIKNEYNILEKDYYDLLNKFNTLYIDHSQLVNKTTNTKNIKLDNSIVELKETIIKQNSQIDSYLEEIEQLKDKSHHGG